MTRVLLDEVARVCTARHWIRRGVLTAERHVEPSEEHREGACGVRKRGALKGTTFGAAVCGRASGLSGSRNNGSERKEG